MTYGNAFKIVFTSLTSVGGAGAIIIALSSWLGKVWAERILQSDRIKYQTEIEKLRADLASTQQRLKSELDKTVHVHRVQFETEFRALSVIWEKMSVVRSTMGAVRPSMEVVDPNKPQEERLRERARPFHEALEGFQRAVDDQSPFYPADILQELDAAIKTATLESIQIRTRRPESDPSWFDQGEANFIKFCECCNRVSDLIRQRIDKLRVHPVT